MANISDLLRQILSARYGRDVRKSIHDSIDQINKDVVYESTNVTSKAAEAAQSATDAETAKTAAETAKTSAETAAASIQGVETTVQGYASAAESAKTAAETAQAAAETAQTAAEAAASSAASVVPEATSDTAGKTKLYNSISDNEDGAITPKAVKQALDNFEGGVSEDDILSSGNSQTETKKKVLDAVEGNANVAGTLAYKLGAVKDSLTNPNLIDNGWFNVNSRGQNEYGSTTKARYTFDRWETVSWYVSVSKTNDIITITNTSDSNIATIAFRQLINETPTGDYTLSVKLEDGTILSGKNVTILVISEGVELKKQNKYILLYLGKGKSISIKAVKLEAGSISTLANDTAPDYQTELLKCQSSTSNASDTYANKSLFPPISDAWLSTKAYAVGDYAIHNNLLWKCLVANTGTTPVEGTTWTQTNASNLFKKMFNVSEKKDITKNENYTYKNNITLDIGKSQVFGQTIFVELKFTVSSSIPSTSGYAGVFSLPYRVKSFEPFSYIQNLDTGKLYRMYIDGWSIGIWGDSIPSGTYYARFVLNGYDFFN